MATAILSTACRDAGLEVISIVLLVLSLLAFVPLAVLDLRRARHPLVLLHRAGFPGQGFAALGFVADTCVLGARLVSPSGVTRVVASVLLGVGVLVWIAIVVALADHCQRVRLHRARGEWLLAVVATEGIAILASDLAAGGYPHTLREAAGATCALGILIYLVLVVVLALRLVHAPLTPWELSPDWWIVMGAPAIIGLAAADVYPISPGPAGAATLACWAAATVFFPVLVAAEVWRARRRTVPHFTPARWTMVFPLGMYSAMCQQAGNTLTIPWMGELGRWWLVIGLGAWLAVAAGELHHAMMRAPLTTP